MARSGPTAGLLDSPSSPGGPGSTSADRVLPARPRLHHRPGLCRRTRPPSSAPPGGAGRARPERGAAEREESRGGGGARARRVPSPPTVRRNPGPGEWRAAPQSNAENSRALRSGNPSRSGNQRGAQRGNAAPERSCAPTARPGRLLPSQALRPLSPQAEREIARPPPSYTPYKPA
ncbi:hypothetical protein R6Z07F_015667 [Ovis aries]